VYVPLANRNVGIRCWQDDLDKIHNCGLFCTKMGSLPHRSDWESDQDWQASELAHLNNAERNARLQDVVRAFVLRASSGVPCHIVDAITGYSWPATYSIDGRLQELSVEVNSQMHWTCHMADVRRVHVWRDDPSDKEIFPPGLRSAMDRQKMRRLVLLEHRDNGRLCLLEEDSDQAENFRVSVSILGLYSREQGSAAAPPVASLSKAAGSSKRLYKGARVGETPTPSDLAAEADAVTAVEVQAV